MATPLPSTLGECTVSGLMHRSDQQKCLEHKHHIFLICHAESQGRGQVGKNCPFCSDTTFLKDLGRDYWMGPCRTQCYQCPWRHSRQGPFTVMIGSVICILQPTSTQQMLRVSRANSLKIFRGNSIAGHYLLKDPPQAFTKTQHAFTKMFQANREQANQTRNWRKETELKKMAPRTSPSRRRENMGV